MVSTLGVEPDLSVFSRTLLPIELSRLMEGPVRFELTYEVLQTPAWPLGYGPVASEVGFEPTQMGLESIMLPLHHPDIGRSGDRTHRAPKSVRVTAGCSAIETSLPCTMRMGKYCCGLAAIPTKEEFGEEECHDEMVPDLEIKVTTKIWLGRDRTYDLPLNRRLHCLCATNQLS